MGLIRSRYQHQTLSQKFKSIITSPEGFPIILTLAVISILFVLFRMKNVELDYKINETNKKLDKALIQNKELKAEKARLLSVRRLKNLAKQNNLSEPKQSQIIVIP